MHAFSSSHSQWLFTQNFIEIRLQLFEISSQQSKIWEIIQGFPDPRWVHPGARSLSKFITMWFHRRSKWNFHPIHSAALSVILHTQMNKSTNDRRTFTLVTGRLPLPWQPASIKFTQCVSGQKSAFSPLQEKLCVGPKNDWHLLELSRRSLSACKVRGR